MGRKYTGTNTFDEAIERVVKLMEQKHRLVCSFSAGKDSGVCLELCVIAAELTGYFDTYGKLDVVMRDEEIMFPGTFEYAERIAERPEIDFHWLVAGQPIINAFNRQSPYWWAFDKQLKPEEWVREPPAYAEWIDDLNIEAMVTPERFPPIEGKNLYDVIGLRVDESRGRLFGLYASGGYVTKPRKNGVAKVRPIYDWNDGDVWKSVLDNRWDYNEAYNVMHRHSVPRRKLRIAPPTMNAAGIPVLKMAQTAWPQWFDRVAERVDGVRTAAQYGMVAVTPDRHAGESWQTVFEREVLGEKNPAWIRLRAQKVHDRILAQHQRHSTAPFPETRACWQCTGDVGCWKNLCMYLYLGDPFCVKTGSILKPVEPDFFRPGAGTWGGGTPAFA